MYRVGISDILEVIIAGYFRALIYSAMYSIDAAYNTIIIYMYIYIIVNMPGIISKRTGKWQVVELV
jgi:hypothetical protein